MPRSIWALGIVSLFMDVSTEMIRSLLPIFLVTVLGASAELLGLIEGIGDATASVTKFTSGWISDRLGRRKALTVAGYGIAALAKALFAMAPTAGWVLAARVADRIGKGIRDTPRDALMGDIVPVQRRGAAYGLRQSLDTLGALAGPLIAMALMELFERRFRLVFAIAIVPASIAVLVLITCVREPKAPQHNAPGNPTVRWNTIRELDRSVWAVLSFGFILTLARFSEAFLLLRARERGLGEALVPLVLVVMNILYAATAYPVGSLSDQRGRRGLLIAGFAVLIVADLTLAIAPAVLVVLIGAALWGLHMGMTQGLLSALVADRAPAPLRGYVFGLFNLCMGAALLLASMIAGLAWQTLGPAATFIAGTVIAAIGTVGFTLMDDVPVAPGLP